MRRFDRTASVALAAAFVAATMGSAVAQRPDRPSRSRGERPEKSLEVGDKAVDFDLKLMGDKKSDETIKLSSFAGKQPVVLIFGSYT
ncbi:MAG: hypothetical protein WD069_06775 [Planctomycetales bacterium]